jgi:uncharacterized protein YegJ (DUF2314 family)
MKKKILVGLLIGFLTLGFVAIVGAETQLEKEAALVPEGFMRIRIINDTDKLMCHNTYWLNHNIPGILGDAPVCGGEIQPGKNHTFDKNISDWNFQGTRIYGTRWTLCRFYNNKEEEYKKYSNDVISEIPEGTAIIEIYFDHFRAIPRVRSK